MGHPLPSRRPASVPPAPLGGARRRPAMLVPVAAPARRQPPRRRMRRTPSVWIAVEWLLLSVAGAVALALVTG
jgi:hypothetical protein